MLWDTMMAYLKSWFSYSGLETHLILISAVLALVFGIIWLLGHQPQFNKRLGLWLVAISSALLTVLAITFVFYPVNYYYGQWLDSTFNSSTLFNWMLLWSIPLVLVTGLVQEGAKMIPMAIWWQGSGKKLDPKMGLIIGAAAGAGFGIFQAFWTHNMVFMSGWTWGAVTNDVWQGLLPFWQQFWVIAANIGVSAILGYGLSKGKGRAFYLLASLLHGILVYLSVLVGKGTLTSNQMEIFLAIAAAIIMVVSLWLRWQKEEGKMLPQPAPPPPPPKPESPGPDKPTTV